MAAKPNAQKKLRVTGDAGEPARAPEALFRNDADDFAEAERDDRQVIAFKPKRRRADGNARNGAASPPASNASEEERCRCRAAFAERIFGDRFGPSEHGDCRRVISAHRHEAGVAERELPGVAVDQVEADRER